MRSEGGWTRTNGGQKQRSPRGLDTVTDSVSGASGPLVAVHWPRALVTAQRCAPLAASRGRSLGRPSGVQAFRFEGLSVNSQQTQGHCKSTSRQEFGERRKRKDDSLVLTVNVIHSHSLFQTSHVDGHDSLHKSVTDWSSLSCKPASAWTHFQLPSYPGAEMAKIAFQLHQQPSSKFTSSLEKKKPQITNNVEPVI